MKYTKEDFTLVPSRQARIGLPANQQVVYMWLCEHSNDNNQSFPSRKVLAYECGISPSTLDRTISELIKQGFIARENRYSSNKQVSNLYTVFIVTKGIQNDKGGVFNMTSPPIQIDAQNPTHITKPIRTQYMSTDVDGIELKTFFYRLVEKLGFSESVKFTNQRGNKLKLRLKTYKPDELLNAAEIISADAFLQGENPSGKRYGTIDYLLRSDEKVDEQINKVNNKVTYKADW